jgi:hypothetical protein
VIDDPDHMYESLTGVGQAKWRCSCGAVETWRPESGGDWSVETLELCSRARWFAHTDALKYHPGPACGTRYGPIMHRKARTELCEDCAAVWAQILEAERDKHGRRRRAYVD